MSYSRLCLLLFGALCACVPAPGTPGLWAQTDPPPQALTVEYGTDVASLVLESFVSGECESISNIRQIGGRTNGIGSFRAPDDLIGFRSGIILSTGDVRDALVGGENLFNTGVAINNGSTPDEDLDRVATSEIYDPSGIEFDFVPLQPLIEFRYVFASEEYCDFIDAEFNDVFGFFIRRADANPSVPSENVALVPGTNQPVSVRTINHRNGNNPELYRGNPHPATELLPTCRGEGTPTERLGQIEFDGQTVVLTARLELEVCATYRIRLVIGDVADGRLDSAVFLEAGSFDIGGRVSLEGAGGGEDDGEPAPQVIVEGCEPTSVRVQRSPGSDSTVAQIIRYAVAPNSTAREGTDFSAGSGEVVIPAGAGFAEIPVTAFEDDLAEGRESFFLFLDIPCACFTDSIELVITDREPLVIELEEATYCPGIPATLRPEVSGGAPPYRYNWDFGSTEANPTLQPPLPANLTLSVTDNCGQTASQTVATRPGDPPNLMLNETLYEVCVGESQQLDLDLEGTGNIDLIYRFNNGRLDTTSFSTPGRTFFPVTASGSYRFVAIRDAACQREVDLVARVRFYAPIINARRQSPSCFGASDGQLIIDHRQTVPPYTYEWSANLGQPDSLTIANLPAGNYSLTVTDDFGCRDEAEIRITSPDPIQPVQITCNELRRPPLELGARGGNPPYAYSVNGTDYFGEEEFNLLEPGTYYDLRIRDSRGCSIRQPEFFYPLAAPQSARLPPVIVQAIGEPTPVDVRYLVPIDQITEYRWSPAEFFDCATCPNPRVSASESGPISLAVDNVFGCTDSLTTLVNVDPRVPVFVPNVFSPNGDGFNDRLTVFGSNEKVDRILEFEVYSRWGDRVYQLSDFPPNAGAFGWDGSVDRLPAPVGTYVWRVLFRLTTGEEIAVTGSAVLMGH